MPTPDRTSLAEIVAAGRDLVEQGGVDALTMQAVATRVGVRAPSLYKRVRNREHLVGLVVDAIGAGFAGCLAEASASGAHPDADATDRLRALAHALRGWVLEHPAAYTLLFIAPERDLASEAALRGSSTAVLDVAEEIVGPDRALEFARTITSWSTGFLAMELGSAFRLGPGVADAFDYGIEVLARGAQAMHA